MYNITGVLYLVTCWRVSEDDKAKTRDDSDIALVPSRLDRNQLRSNLPKQA